MSEVNEKVVLTQEQADAIERYNVHQLGQWFYEVKDNVHVLNDLFKCFTIEELMRAKLIGYEVKPQFKVGDWLAYWNGDIYVIGQAVTNSSNNLIYVEDGNGEKNVWYVNHVRHATEEEIADEKERRWWNSHGRGVWELKQGDVVVDDRGCAYTVKKIKVLDGVVVFVEGIETSLWEIKRRFKVACFAEDRKDV